MSTKKRKAAGVPAEAPAPSSSDAVRRVMVRISEADYLDMTRHFAEAKPGLPLVSVHPAAKRQLTTEQRKKRKAYRQRPDVREKQKAYRASRAKRIREALAKAGAQVRSETDGVTQA
jgi:hypothetical protein